jgi:hypothetical protein
MDTNILLSTYLGPYFQYIDLCWDFVQVVEEFDDDDLEMFEFLLLAVDDSILTCKRRKNTNMVG